MVSVLDQLSTYLALTFQEGSPALEKVRQEVKVQRGTLQALVLLCKQSEHYHYVLGLVELTGQIKKGFNNSDGPFVKALDDALKSFKVKRQAYYGGTFVGNHVHKTLKI